MSDPVEILPDLEVVKPQYLGGGNWVLKKMTPITIIFGKNGSGKSILLRTIRSKNNQNCHYCVPERAGSISYQAQDVVEELNPDRRANRSTQNLGPKYRDGVIARISAFLQKRGLSRTPPDAQVDKIESTLNDLLPDFEFKIMGDAQPFLLKRVSSGEQISDISQLSSGESQLLTLGLDLLLICNMWELENHTGTLLIDEPDVNIHPDLQQRLAKFLYDLSTDYKCNLIISTHSTTLLSALGYYGGNKTSVIYLDRKNEQNAIRFDDALKTISTCLGGHALMGPLFSFPILLVEGDDDYRIWSEIPRYHEVKISVIPCNGDEIRHYQKTLERLFSSILDSSTTSSGYALLDGDKSVPATTQNHIKYIKLACHESENLYLSDEILSSINGLTWDAVCEKVIKESVKYGSKATSLQQIRTWDRKIVDCKSLINEIATILDDKKLLWSQRLGKELGKNKPKGQLAEFLGDEVVNAIWK